MNKQNWVKLVLGASIVTSVMTGNALAAIPTTTLTLYSSGDVNVQQLWENDLIPVYEKANPNVQIKVVYSAHGTNDQATEDRIIAAEKAKKDSGYDIIDAGFVNDLAKANLLQKLNNKEIPRLFRVQASLLKQNAYEGLPYRGSSVVLAYNSTDVQNPPTTLSGLVQWIKANPGKFTYNTPDTGGSGNAFVTAMINMDVPKADQAKLVTSSDKSLETTWTKGLNLLKSLGPDIYRNGYYPTGNTGTLNLLANGSIWVAPVWSDMALSALAQKQLPSSIKLVQLNPAFSGGPADLGVVANSKHTAAADAFMNWVLSPKAQTIVINQMNGYPGVQWKYVPKAVQVKFASIAKSYASGWSSFFGADMNQAWQNNVASGN